MGGLSVLLIATAGCATKNYVRNQTAPLVQHTNELEDQTAANHRQLQDVDQRAQQGIQQVQTAANTANQKAVNAGQAATQAQQSAQETLNRADSLADVVSNLDTYHQVADVSVHFGFDKSALTAKDRRTLDIFADQLADAKSYILELTGGTDSTGNKAYNYQLSQRRAETVARYLTAKYNVPPHKIYLIGIGKDVEIASNHTAAGRAENRRVRVQLLSNSGQNAGANQQTGASQGISQPEQGNPNTPSGTSQGQSGTATH
jgi:outer membrane protein OmpA-like peptidoglycan-associated protein